MDKVHLESKHTELGENGKKGDMTAKKINAINVVRKAMLGMTNLLRWKVM